MTAYEIDNFLDVFKDAIGDCYERLLWSKERCLSADGAETISFKLQVSISGLGKWTCLFPRAFMNENSLDYVVQRTRLDFEEAVKDRRRRDEL
jgi:hypothetical protein